MNLSNIRLPRELEVDGNAGTIRKVLGARTVQLWAGSDLSIPMITMGEPLKKVIRRAGLNGQIRWGLEAISDKLKEEEKGIANLREGRGLPTGDRVSRLLLISNDGAERFYRHIERLLQAHAPRLFVCMVDMDGNELGSMVTGREKQIKVVMAEHKSVVAEILRAMAIG
jgi:hypothetical protein